jgi:hypothetical protein
VNKGETLFPQTMLFDREAEHSSESLIQSIEINGDFPRFLSTWASTPPQIRYNVPAGFLRSKRPNNCRIHMPYSQPAAALGSSPQFGQRDADGWIGCSKAAGAAI